MAMNIIIEGPDRCGKDTLINNIRSEFTKHKFSVVHSLGASKLKNLNTKELEEYSKDLFNSQFDLMLTSSVPLIFNRSHIGEFVYAPLYRKYSGTYVFDIEEKYQHVCNNTFLILLYDEPETLFSRDDGCSHSSDVNMIKTEIGLFKDGVYRSNIKNKIVVNCHNKTIEDVANEVITQLKPWVEKYY